MAGRLGFLPRVTTDDPKDKFLLAQFVNYLEREPYAGIGSMIKRDEVEAIGLLNQRKLREKETDFLRKAWSLMERLKSDLSQSFPDPEKAQILTDGSSWTYLNATAPGSANCYVQFGFHNQPDPQLPLADYLPEFGVWVAVQPRSRAVLDSDENLRNAGPALLQAGYKLNIPSSRELSWLVCYWFAPILHFMDGSELDTAMIRQEWEDHLRSLVTNKFLRHLVEVLHSRQTGQAPRVS